MLGSLTPAPAAMLRRGACMKESGSATRYFAMRPNAFERCPMSARMRSRRSADCRCDDEAPSGGDFAGDGFAVPDGSRRELRLISSLLPLRASRAFYGVHRARNPG